MDSSEAKRISNIKFRGRKIKIYDIYPDIDTDLTHIFLRYGSLPFRDIYDKITENIKYSEISRRILVEHVYRLVNMKRKQMLQIVKKTTLPINNGFPSMAHSNKIYNVYALINSDSPRKRDYKKLPRNREKEKLERLKIRNQIFDTVNLRQPILTIDLKKLIDGQGAIINRVIKQMLEEGQLIKKETLSDRRSYELLLNRDYEEIINND